MISRRHSNLYKDWGGEHSTMTTNAFLRHGTPVCGLGTFRASGQDLQIAVAAALRNGITHIDTASVYKNEADIAAALEAQSVPRQDVYITSKISPYQQGTDKATQACEEILRRLNTDYVDLLLIHFPGVARTPPKSPANAELRWQTWQVLEQMHQQGKTRAIGVSNYTIDQLQQLLDRAAIKPAVNQVEVHPRWPQTALRRFCATAGVDVVAYASLGCGDLLTHPLVQQLAAKNSKTPSQVLLRWAIQQGCAVIPKSVHPAYISEFGPEQLLTWQLSSEDMASLDAMQNDEHKYCWDPSDVA